MSVSEEMRTDGKGAGIQEAKIGTWNALVEGASENAPEDANIRRSLSASGTVRNIFATSKGLLLNFHDMSDFYSYQPVPIWRIVMYGVLAAASVAALGYFQHDHTLYIFAVLCGVFSTGFGFVASWIRSHLVPGQEALMRIPASSQMNMLRLIRILAVPTALMGCMALQDLFLDPPVKDVATISSKYANQNRRSITYTYCIEARGDVLYRESVDRSFWRQCKKGDEIKLTITPRFKECLHLSLMRNGEVVAESTNLGAFFWLGVGGACFFVPCLFFLPFVSKTVPDPCSWEDIKLRIFSLFVEAFALFWAFLAFSQ